MHNTFTYRYSELPSVPSEVQTEFVAVEFQINNLISKSVGNYRSLEQLAEILTDCLDSCNLNLQSIRIIADSSPPPTDITMVSLPMQEQTIIFGTALFSALALGTLQKLTKVDPKLLLLKITEQINIEMKDLSDEQITASLKDYLEKYRDAPMQQAFKMKIPTDT